MILVVKKEKHNLHRLKKALFETYPELAEKRVLFIDDEADFASIGFSKTKNEIYEMNVLAGEIDEIRSRLNQCDFLQVTATPYSLYLQPEHIKLKGAVFQPIKPVFTELVPVPAEYIGGDYYFDESEKKDTIASLLYEPISSDELLVLKKPDRRRLKIEDVLTNRKIHSLRSAVLNFITGGMIRRMKHERNGERLKKYSFVIHTSQTKSAHEWQEVVVQEMKRRLSILLANDPILMTDLIQEAYDNIKNSLLKLESYVPGFEEVKYEVIQAIGKDHLLITKVNSEKEMSALLDESGQLKLRAPLNIFIGGQILDRGITIGNLIGFYYGRHPKTYQQDTVLQHSRMFGYRQLEDLAVTRFYTTEEIYNVMNTIHEFDTALRHAIEKSNDQGVVFIQKDAGNQLIPCSPNKIVLSKVTTLKPFKRLLPVGFQTGYKSYISKTVQVQEIDQLLDKLVSGREPVLIDLKDAAVIIEKIQDTFDPEAGKPWDVNAFFSSLEYLSKSIPGQEPEKVWCIVRKNRNISRVRQRTGRFEDAPDTSSGINNEFNTAKRIADKNPVLILTSQEGSADPNKGWRGAPFWWPVLVTPRQTPTAIFTSGTEE
ncbi:Z1 domain-containing protein [Domibacillus antri]|uniref:Z1 domain-containing protein n=1 Tax=Domibacillus antri TaxID=1714264 RepID=UPI000A8A247E|nr:Z1 domain-containing protein [Domibacillus antri]